MDNLTHTIAGLWTGEFAHKVAGGAEASLEDQKRRRGWFLWAGATANNFPDLDLVFNTLLPAPLSYLLHHRGHTHTLVFAFAQSALLLLMFYCIPSFRKFWKEDRTGRNTALALMLLGTCFHIAFDSFNSYGVHPFWPFNSRWFYGDIVFIIEPTLWIVFGLPFILSTPRKWVRYAWYVFLAGVITTFAVMKFLPLHSVAMLVALATAIVLGQRSEKTRFGGILISILCFVLFIGTQKFASRLAYAKATSATSERAPDERVLDHALTPLPANPLCWTFVSTSIAGEDYFLRRGTLAIFPDLVSVEKCALPLKRFMQPEIVFETKSVRILQEQRFSAKAIAERADTDCFFEAWLRFVRAPAFDNEKANDWRFTAQGDDNFTTLRFKDFAGQKCEPHKYPSWLPPRADLLELGRKLKN